MIAVQEQVSAVSQVLRLQEPEFLPEPLPPVGMTELAATKAFGLRNRTFRWMGLLHSHLTWRKSLQCGKRTHLLVESHACTALSQMMDEAGVGCKRDRAEVCSLAERGKRNGKEH